jgi:hypothetical protein
LRLTSRQAHDFIGVDPDAEPAIIDRGMIMQRDRWNKLAGEYGEIRVSNFAEGRPRYKRVLAALNSCSERDETDLHNLYIRSLVALQNAPIVTIADAVAALRHCVDEPGNYAVPGILKRVVKALQPA